MHTLKTSVLSISILNWRLKNQWIKNSENHNLFVIVSLCVCGCVHACVCVCASVRAFVCVCVWGGGGPYVCVS